MSNTYYIDYNRGSDSNNGTSISTPWQNLSKLATASALVSGDNLLLADDSRWDITAHVLIASGWTGTKASPVTIGKYSPASASQSNPIISRKRSIAANEWTYDAPNNGWYMTWFGADIMWGCYVRLGGSDWGIRQEAALPLESVDRTWKEAATGKFYVYAPAGTTPTDYYGSVEFAPHSRGSFSFSSNGTNVIIQDIDSEDGGGLLSVYSGSGTRDFLVRRCRFSRTGTSIYLSTDTGGQASLEVADCNFSQGISAYVHSIGSVGFGGLYVHNNDFLGGNDGYPQGNVYMQSRGSRNLIFGNSFAEAKYGTVHHTQDGCAIFAEVGANDVMVIGNEIRDTYMAMQDNTGRQTTWSGNLIINCRQAMKVTDASSVGSTNHRYWNNTHIGCGNPLSPDGGVAGGGIGWYCFDDFAIDLRNNRFVMHASAVAQPAIETGTATTGTIANNSHSGGFTALAKAYTGAACPITASGTVTTDTSIDEIIDSTNACYQAGTLISNPPAYDYYGKEITSTPDIGAIQVYAARSRPGTERSQPVTTRSIPSTNRTLTKRAS